MARVGNSENLKQQDRYDLLLLSFPDGFPNSKLEFTLGNNPRKITGLQKVVQVLVKCLMTSTGTDPIYPKQGTKFSEFVWYSNITQDSVAAKAAITAAIKQASDQAKAILNSYLYSAESQLESVEVLDAVQGSETTIIKVRVLTKAGVGAPIALPFNSNGLVLNEVTSG
jgi:hypothetical protein